MHVAPQSAIDKIFSPLQPIFWIVLRPSKNQPLGTFSVLTLPAAASRPHFPALDGVRGIAIILVMLTHYGEILRHGGTLEQALGRVCATGWIGVDLFFVLSGFLITGILLDSKGSRFYFRQFYWRRTVRIFPVYFLFLAFVFIGLRLLFRHFTGQDPWRATHPWWYLTYLSNWMPGHGKDDLYVSHFWSLAVEEQFYFVWPAVVLLCTRRRLATACAFLAATALLLRWVLIADGASSTALYRLTPCRMDPLVLGALIALVMRDEVWRGRLRRWLFPLAASAAIVVASVAWRSGSFDFDNGVTETAGVSALAILFACAVFYVVAWKGRASSLLETSWLRTAGRYSYAVYVVHVVPHLLLFRSAEALIGRQSRLLQPLLRGSYIGGLFALSFGAGWISWRVLEKPLLKLKDRLPVIAGKRPTLLELGGKPA
jgi:peptidoglycan/LPS O-acetylase OafA/YrhL